MKNDIVIKVIDPDGKVHILDCPLDIGLNLKDICKAYELPMEAMCGGMAMCATCHCYITKGLEFLPLKSDIEDALLSELFNTKPNSRLACQIPITEEMDGLELEICAE